MSIAGLGGAPAKEAQTKSSQDTNTGAAPSYEAPAAATGLASGMSNNTPLITGSQISGVVQQFLDAAKNLAPERRHGYKIEFIPLTNEDFPNLYYSSVIAAVSLVNSPNFAVAYHVLLLADSNNPPESLQQNINNLNVEILRPPSDAYDNDYRTAVINALSARYPSVPTNAFIDAYAEIVPSGFDFKNEHQTKLLISNAVHAATTSLNGERPEWKDLSLISVKGTNLEMRLSFHQPNRATAGGLPVRSDISMVTSEVLNRQAPKPGERPGLNSGSTNKTVSGIHGYLDLLYAPDPNNVQTNPFLAASQQQQASLKTYLPTFIITKIDAPLLSTLPGLLLNLSMLAGLSAGNNWVGALQTPRGTDFYPHDIGVLGLEVPVARGPDGQQIRVNTRSDSFRPEVLAHLVQAICHDKVIVQMDVEDADSETWLKAIFRGATLGNDLGERCRKAIISAADLLTNGHFSKFYTKLGGGDPVFSAKNRITLGYYRDKGLLKDKRELDQLAVMNLRENEPEVWRLWSDTFTQGDVNMDVRLHVRNGIERDILGDYTVTGMATRVVINPKLIAALSAAVAACELPVRLITPYSDPSSAARGSASWLSQYGLSGDANSLFSRTSTAPNGGFGGNFGGRWG